MQLHDLHGGIRWLAGGSARRDLSADVADFVGADLGGKRESQEICAAFFGRPERDRRDLARNQEGPAGLLCAGHTRASWANPLKLHSRRPEYAWPNKTNAIDWRCRADSRGDHRTVAGRVYRRQRAPLPRAFVWTILRPGPPMSPATRIAHRSGRRKCLSIGSGSSISRLSHATASADGCVKSRRSRT